MDASNQPLWIIHTNKLELANAPGGRELDQVIICAGAFLEIETASATYFRSWDEDHRILARAMEPENEYGTTIAGTITPR